MKKYLLLLMAVCVAGLGNKLSAQEWAIKSNMLYDATTTINFGIEKTIAPSGHSIYRETIIRSSSPTI